MNLQDSAPITRFLNECFNSNVNFRAYKQFSGLLICPNDNIANIHLHIYLSWFGKRHLWKIAGFWAKSGQNATGLIPMGPPAAPKQPKSPNCWDGGEKGRRRGEKSQICTSSPHIGYFGDSLSRSPYELITSLNLTKASFFLRKTHLVYYWFWTAVSWAAWKRRWPPLRDSILFHRICKKELVSKETVMQRRWESGTQEFRFTIFYHRW